MEADYVNVVEPLENEGEALVKANIVAGETILVKLPGLCGWEEGEAFVVTDRRIYVLKWGMYTGHTFSGHCGAYGFSQITGVNVRTGFLGGILEVLTAADRNTGEFKNPMKADNMLMFNWARQGEAFQRAVSIARREIHKAMNTGIAYVVEHQSGADEIEKLAQLRDKGILTEEEFQAKKKQLLGL